MWILHGTSKCGNGSMFPSESELITQGGWGISQSQTDSRAVWVCEKQAEVRHVWKKMVKQVEISTCVLPWSVFSLSLSLAKFRPKRISLFVQESTVQFFTLFSFSLTPKTAEQATCLGFTTSSFGGHKKNWKSGHFYITTKLDQKEHNAILIFTYMLFRSYLMICE